MHRREFLKVGVLGAGLSLSQYLRLSAADSRQRSALLVFLRGGPSHLDTFDLKPEAPAEYRGEFRPIATSVPGVNICEHLPRLARCADRYALVRHVTHNLADHGIGTRYLLTGNRPTPLLDYPVLGAVVSKELPGPAHLPGYVAIEQDEVGPGYLGTQYGALGTGEKPRPGQPFRVRGISLDEGLTLSHLQRRRRLLDDIDQAFRGFEQLDDHVQGLDRFSQQAYRIITSPETRAAFDLNQEQPDTVRRFGANEWGQTLLLSTRLIEAGVRFVTAVLDNWDTHNDNFRTLRTEHLPRLDQGLSVLLDTMRERGLLATTTVLVTGEFGRTPRINGNAGRDHWARAMSVLFAGAGIECGQVLGATNARGEEPDGAACKPDDIAATLYHALGIDPQRELHTATGRPVAIVRDGRPIRGLRS